MSNTGPLGEAGAGAALESTPAPNSHPGTGNLGEEALASEKPAWSLAQREWEHRIRFSLGFSPWSWISPIDP